ncbi:hypothetical protein L2E82_08092 [Cichorium intybus]|uniref:Uncharacterized protein n=1 Tax=Cichorium intybus TaxID=13427 RepID=A0ACB9G5A2_CICIN|nr:hypothetical protein L2E82_08092 [Cichorium intybus]
MKAIFQSSTLNREPYVRSIQYNCNAIGVILRWTINNCVHTVLEMRAAKEASRGVVFCDAIHAHLCAQREHRSSQLCGGILMNLMLRWRMMACDGVKLVVRFWSRKLGRFHGCEILKLERVMTSRAYSEEEN